MIPLLTAQEMRSLDRYTIDRVGVPGPVLMEAAGRAVVEVLRRDYAAELRRGPVAVFCGRGNNGGDGFVIARCLHNCGCEVRTYLLGAAASVAGDAALHLAALRNSGGTVVELTAADAVEGRAAAAEAALLVDAVLGTGLTDAVRGPAAAAVGWMNESPAPVVAVDVPSGVDSDTGRARGCAVAAELTVTFAYPKRGLYLHPGARLAGRVEVAEIGIPQGALAALAAPAGLAEPADLGCVPARQADAHKGDLGHVVVCGGSRGKGGAAGLAASAALRSGAGLATVAWPAGVREEARLPLEVMTLPLGAAVEAPAWSEVLWEEAAQVLGAATALVVGPGMGLGAGPAGFLDRLLGQPHGLPAVVDADALNWLAGRWGTGLGALQPWVLTPHPGEAGRLLGSSAAAVQEDRFVAAQALVERYRCVVILKGAATLVAGPGQPTVLIPRGNPGMATAGSGDVLAGVVGALLARGLAPFQAAWAGAFLHATAGDLAGRRVGVEGMTAADLLAALPAALREARGTPEPAGAGEGRVLAF